MRKPKPYRKTKSTKGSDLSVWTRNKGGGPEKWRINKENQGGGPSDAHPNLEQGNDNGGGYTKA